MFLIYISQNSPRLSYVLNFIFNEMYGFDFKTTKDKDYFKSFSGCKLNYSKEIIGDEFFIKSNDFINDLSIKKVSLNISSRDGFEIFFQNNSDLNFDLFSAIFYLLSRYEEYLPAKKDKYGRFSAQESLAFKNNFLNKPLINIWLHHFKVKLKSKYPDIKFKKHNFSYISTIDIDQAYAYKHQHLYRNIISFLKILLNCDIKKIKLMLNVILKKEKNPFDTFEKQFKINNFFNVKPFYFILLSDYGLYDKNNHYKNRKFQKLIQNLNSKYTLGLHPSYQSNRNYRKINVELNRLSSIINQSVNISKQHYLKISFPSTYRELMKLGIEKDFSLGYASLPGFRASICHPFKFYDLENEKETGFVIYPFQIMDTTFKHYNQSNFTHEAKKYIDLVKKYNGIFISIFHNDSFYLNEWSNNYEEMLKCIFND